MSESSSGANDCVNKKIDKRMNGVINSEGNFIPLTERGKSLEELLNHPYIRVLIQKVKTIHNELSYIDKIVNMLGYVIYNYNENLQIIYPKNKVYGPEFTTAQIVTVLELAGKYNEKPEELYEALEGNPEKSESKVYSSHGKIQSA